MAYRLRIFKKTSRFNQILCRPEEGEPKLLGEYYFHRLVGVNKWLHDNCLVGPIKIGSTSTKGLILTLSRCGQVFQDEQKSRVILR